MLDVLLLCVQGSARVMPRAPTMPPPALPLSPASDLSRPCSRNLFARWHDVVCGQVLRDHGQGLVQELVKCCSGELPSYSIDGDGGSVAGLLWRISVLCPAWLQVRQRSVRAVIARSYKRTDGFGYAGDSLRIFFF